MIPNLNHIVVHLLDFHAYNIEYSYFGAYQTVPSSVLVLGLERLSYPIFKHDQMLCANFRGGHISNEFVDIFFFLIIIHVDTEFETSSHALIYCILSLCRTFMIQKLS